MNSGDTLLTTRQLQDLLQVDRITIYRMLSDGRLRGFKVGGQWRFSKQAIEQWILGQQESPKAPGTLGLDNHLCPSDWPLPTSCIQAIQDIFAEAMGIGTIMTAPDGTPITPISNSCEFCNLILGTEGGRWRCTRSWKAAGLELAPGFAGGSAPQIAVCHAGLCYAWGRIEVQGRFVAAIHAGQFLTGLTQSDGSWPERIAELSGVTHLEAQVLHRALERVPVLDGHRQRQVPVLLQRVARTFSELGQERLELLGRLQRIAEISTV